MKIKVVYHAHCLDGLVAAWVCYRYFSQVPGQEVVYETASYGDDPVSVEGIDELVIVDFSYPPAVLKEIADKGVHVIVCDHHKTAIEALAGFQHENVSLVLDQELSGAGIALMMYPSSDPCVRSIVLHAQDRDLWKFAVPWTREITRALMVLVEMNVVQFDAGMRAATPEMLIDAGQTLIANDERQMQSLEERVHIVSYLFGAKKVPIVNCPPWFSSELLGKLAEQADCGFALSYSVGKDARVHWSARSRKGVDVTKIAGRFGGGGHAAAAGFRTDLLTLVSIIHGTEHSF